jgi:hypothetical protein
MPSEKRTYHILSEDEKDDMIASTLLSQERDDFSHATNIDRYEEMLKDPNMPAKFRSRVEELLSETRNRLAEVRTIENALEKELPAANRLNAAVARLHAKEAAAQVAQK